MKKLILSLVAAAFAVTTFAHGNENGMHQGNILLYGVAGFYNQNGSSTSKFGNLNSRTTDNPRVRNYHLSPGIGLNVTDNLTIGVDAYYDRSTTDFDKDALHFGPGHYPYDRIQTFDYGVGPFVRYSQPLSEYFFAFGQLTSHFVKGRETYRTVTQLIGGNSWVSDNDYRGFNVSIIPAVGAMLTKSLGLTFSVGGIAYEYRKYDYSPYLMGSNTPGSNFEGRDNQFSFTFGQQFNFGIQKYFGCGHMRHRGNAEPMDDTRRMDTSDDDDSSRRRNRRNDDE